MFWKKFPHNGIPRLLDKLQIVLIDSSVEIPSPKNINGRFASESSFARLDMSSWVGIPAFG